MEEKDLLEKVCSYAAKVREGMTEPAPPGDIEEEILEELKKFPTIGEQSIRIAAERVAKGYGTSVRKAKTLANLVPGTSIELDVRVVEAPRIMELKGKNVYALSVSDGHGLAELVSWEKKPQGWEDIKEGSILHVSAYSPKAHADIAAQPTINIGEYGRIEVKGAEENMKEYKQPRMFIGEANDYVKAFFTGFVTKVFRDRIFRYFCEKCSEFSSRKRCELCGAELQPIFSLSGIFSDGTGDMLFGASKKDSERVAQEMSGKNKVDILKGADIDAELDNISTDILKRRFSLEGYVRIINSQPRLYVTKVLKEGVN